MKRLALVAALAVAGCCSSHISSDFQAGDAENAIRRIDGELSAAANAGNAAALAGFYASDAVLMPPNAPAQRGRDAIQKFWTGFLSLGRIDLRLTTDEVVQSGDLAVEAGSYALTITPGSGAPIRDSGKFLVRWRKDNGTWQLARDIFNSDLPAPK
jgi:uncharacterized protein (TIGR02246 family)